jgi:FMN phosphatase YigB (HAD superfamily)
MKNNTVAPSTSLDVSAIPELLTQHAGQIRVLSLDCFDTLLWRTVSEPVEVFKDLQNQLLFLTHGVCAESRCQAERRVRQLRAGLYEQHEVTIEEIYEQLLPGAPSELVQEFVRAEIETEKKYLFAYLPMFDLLETAKKMGIKTVLVSDMYIHGHQLKELVESCAKKANIRVDIDHYFTSADHRTTKGRELFHVVAKQVGVPTNAFLHVGDNPHADLNGARRAGLVGYHFNRFTPLLEDCMRKNANMQRLLSNDHGESVPMVSNWHATWSRLPRTNNTMEMLGWYYLGPVMVQYLQWLMMQVQELKALGQRPRIVFMMRDGYLPFKSYQSLQAQGLVPYDTPVHAMDVSRFATLALNFHNATGVQTYLISQKEKMFRSEMVRQLMGVHELDTVKLKINTDDTLAWSQFMQEVLLPENLQCILEASAKHRAHFIRYFRKHIRPKSGETVVLADLGYSGTIQDQLKMILAEEFDIQLEGRYLILREASHNQAFKKGLIDYRSINRNALTLLLTQIQTLEQLTVNDNGSLVRYGETGQPVYEKSPLSDQQRLIKQHVQTATHDFVKTQSRSILQFSNNHAFSYLEAAGLIGRFTLQPSLSEMDLYQQFSHDINNGTTRLRWISNPAMSRQMLIRGGNISYDNEYHKMLANDLNAFAPELSHFNFLKTRLGFKPTLMDHKFAGGDIPCVLSQGENFQQTKMPCFNTHEGFKIGILRGVKNCSAVGLSFGLQYDWLQIHSMALVNWGQFASDPGWQARVDLIPKTHAEGGQSVGQGLIHFENSDGYLHVDLKEGHGAVQDEMVMLVVFRDIGARTASPSKNGAQHEASKVNNPSAVETQID